MKFMNNQIQLIIPEWFVLDELHIIETVIGDPLSETGMVIAGENLDATKYCCPTIRLYMIRLVGDQYELMKELDAFQFQSVEDAKAFCAKLPQLNAIDLIMLMNKEEPMFAL